MLRSLTLKNKILFLSLSSVWTIAFTYWVYVGYQWDREQQMMSEQYEGPEAYYP